MSKKTRLPLTPGGLSSLDPRLSVKWGWEVDQIVSLGWASFPRSAWYCALTGEGQTSKPS